MQRRALIPLCLRRRFQGPSYELYGKFMYEKKLVAGNIK